MDRKHKIREQYLKAKAKKDVYEPITRPRVIPLDNNYVVGTFDFDEPVLDMRAIGAALSVSTVIGTCGFLVSKHDVPFSYKSKALNGFDYYPLNPITQTTFIPNFLFYPSLVMSSDNGPVELLSLWNFNIVSVRHKTREDIFHRFIQPNKVCTLNYFNNQLYVGTSNLIYIIDTSIWEGTMGVIDRDSKPVVKSIYLKDRPIAMLPLEDELYIAYDSLLELVDLPTRFNQTNRVGWATGNTSRYMNLKASCLFPYKKNILIGTDNGVFFLDRSIRKDWGVERRWLKQLTTEPVESKKMGIFQDKLIIAQDHLIKIHDLESLLAGSDEPLRTFETKEEITSIEPVHQYLAIGTEGKSYIVDAFRE